MMLECFYEISGSEFQTNEVCSATERFFLICTQLKFVYINPKIERV